MLTQTQKVAIRRHLGVPFAGTAQAGRLYGWRFTWYAEDLEYRMNNMQPPEEALITGATLGSYQIDGRPTVGDLVTYTITDPTPRTIAVPYTVTLQDFMLPASQVNPADSSPLYAIALNSALAINNAASQFGYAAVGVMPADLFSPQFMPPYFAEVLITSAGQNKPFTLTAAQTGTTNLLVSNPGSPTPVRAAPIDPITLAPTPVYGFVSLCDAYAMQVSRADLSLWLSKADVVDFRRDEVAARDQLYGYYCMKLEEVLGGKDYVEKFGGGGGGGAVA